MALIVQKFGGSSVKDAERMKAVAQKVIEEHDRGNDVVTVVSAMGKSTDNMISLVHEITDDPPARELDMVLASGEQLSCAVLAMAIGAMGRKAISFTGPQVGIKTNRVHGRARIVHINDAKVRNALEEDNIVIVAGFQGTYADHEITTLGRGGSDTTAVALAAALKADRCDIYTDVDGVYTADPRFVPTARRLDHITYDEMLELASLGAKVLHGRSVEIAKNYNIPLRVLSSYEPGPGTLVVEEYEGMENFIVSGVTCDQNQSKFSILGVPDKPGMAAKVFERLGEANIPVDMIIQNVAREGRNNITFTVHISDFNRTMEIAESVCKEIGAREVQTEKGIAKLSVVGVGMKSHANVASKVFNALASIGINIGMVATSEICISCIIEPEQAETALNALHDAFELGESVPAGQA